MKQKHNIMAICPKRLNIILRLFDFSLGGHHLKFLNEFLYFGHIITKYSKHNVDINNRKTNLRCHKKIMVT